MSYIHVTDSVGGVGGSYISIRLATPAKGNLAVENLGSKHQNGVKIVPNVLSNQAKDFISQKPQNSKWCYSESTNGVQLLPFHSYKRCMHV